MMKTIEQVINEEGFIIREIKGNSMYPLLRNGKDVVRLIKTDIINKGDVVLFLRKQDDYVLHRVIKCTDSGYIIKGDNCLEKEIVSKEQIIAVMDGIYKSGRYYDKNHIKVKKYKLLRFINYPLCFIRKKIHKI